jgi:hypothetical protein
VNKIAKFRNVLAEKGIEMTLEQATKVYKMSNDLIKRSKKMSMKDLWAIQDVEGVSQEEKDQIIKLYQHAKEL